MKTALLLMASPLIALVMAVFWLVCAVGDVVLKVLAWPYRVLSGVALLVLGGGKR